MKPLQLILRNHWDFVEESVVLSWTSAAESDLEWWSDARHLLDWVSLVSPQPDLLFWSDVLAQGWWASLLNQFVSGRWLLVERGVLDQPPRAPGYLVRSAPLQSFSAGSFDEDAFGQHHCSVVHSQTGGHVFTGLESRDPTSPSLGRVFEHHFGAPVHNGGKERGCGFVEPSRPCHRLGVDLGSGGGR